VLGISFTTVTYLDKMSDLYESWEGPFLSRINNSKSEIQYSESGIQNSESGDYFPLSLFRGWLYHVIITYRLAAVTIEYKYEIIEECTFKWGSKFKREVLNVCLLVCLMVFNVTFNNMSVISWRSFLFVDETGGPG
jgi:hypothetical protein